MAVNRCNTSTIGVLALSLFFVAPSVGTTAERLSNQIYNRMLYIRATDNSETFVNMPNYFDLGSPSISLDGKWIAFDGLTIGTQPERESWVVDKDGNGLRKIADGGVPRWSPDGKRLLIKRLVTEGRLAGRFEVAEYEVATGKNRTLFEGRYADWSPDGKKIAFAKQGERTENSGVHPGSKIWIANADGSESKELCDGDWPSWSPDDKMIAYCVQEAGQPGEIWTIDLDGKKKTKIGLGHYRAQWTGDSKRFVCNGSFYSETAKAYGRVPAMFSIDQPMKPHYFAIEMDNPWSPCVSRDGKMMVMIVDSQKKREKAASEEN